MIIRTKVAAPALQPKPTAPPPPAEGARDIPTAIERDPDAPIAHFSSGITAIYGNSGSGKSSLADTASEYVAERFSQGTMCVAIDPGGWGNRRLSLIHNGVMQVYDPRNHINFFETMEALTLGAWPEKISDPDRGYADPNVRLVKPRQPVWMTKCPQGHAVAQYTTEAAMVAAQVKCPTCDVLVTSQTVAVERVVIRPAMFQQIGLRIFDSLTAMNDMGLIIELPSMSARGELPTSTTGGSALGSADALRQGEFVAGTGSVAQVGFMQNRTYGWLVNIRTIPDQVLGAICTFGVEQSKDDEKTGGEMCYGPSVAGRARTAKVPGWVGNCTHATKEPDAVGNMRYRLWLTNHIDPRDPYKLPYLAKHRGTPLGMPDFLEDPWDDDPIRRAELAWSGCSLKQFFLLLEAQFDKIQATDQERFAKFREDRAAIEAKDEVVAVASTRVAGGPTAAVTAGTGGRTLPKRGLRRVGAATPATPAPAAPPAVAVTMLQPTTVVGGEPTGEPTSETQAQETPEVASTQPPSPAPSPPPPVPTPTAGLRRLRRSARPPTA